MRAVLTVFLEPAILPCGPPAAWRLWADTTTTRKSLFQNENQKAGFGIDPAFPRTISDYHGGHLVTFIIYSLMLLPIILSDGVGARLWPVSREALPKPLIELPHGGTLLQKTLQHAANLGEDNIVHFQDIYGRI